MVIAVVISVRIRIGLTGCGRCCGVVTVDLVDGRNRGSYSSVRPDGGGILFTGVHGGVAVVDGGTSLAFVARALCCRNVVFIPIHKSSAAASFAFGRFAFAVTFTFAFAFFAFSLSVVSMAASRFGINRQVAILADQEIGEGREIARHDVVVVHFPRCNDRIELRPTLNRIFECLDLGDVGHLLIEAAERLVVIDSVTWSMKSSKFKSGRLRSFSTVVISCKVGVL